MAAVAQRQGGEEQGSMVIVRKEGEGVQIGPDVVVRIAEGCTKGRIRLLIQAPRSVAVKRVPRVEDSGDREIPGNAGR